MIDVTDATFEQAVIARSAQVPVVVDLWAPWCGPCKTLGPILERVVAETEGAVELVKVNVDENPRVSATFQVQSIPAVFALRDGKVVDEFIGALPEAQVAEFVERLAPQPSEADQLGGGGRRGVAAPGPRARAGPPRGRRGRPGPPADRAAARPTRRCEVLAKIPETPETRVLAAEARLAASHVDLRRGRRRTPCSTRCSTGPATTRRPARSSSTCSRPSGPTIRAPPVPQGAGGPAVLMRGRWPAGCGPAAAGPRDAPPGRARWRPPSSSARVATTCATGPSSWAS